MLVAVVMVARIFYGLCWGFLHNLGHNFCWISWRRSRNQDERGKEEWLIDAIFSGGKEYMRKPRENRVGSFKNFA